MFSFAIHTLGCKVNTYESDLISQKMKESGFVEVDFEEKADIYIINTCTVTNIADRKSRQMLHRAKKRNPNALIIATGCYVDSVEQGKGLPAEDVDLWVPNREKTDLPALCAKKLKQEPCSTGLFLTHLDGHTRAFVKIEDGCNMFCTYCIIPYVRGNVTPRPTEDTVREVTGLAEKGVREIVLTGIHLSSMGKQLLETVEAVDRISGIERIRLGSLEPRFITGETLKRLAACKKLCPHFHLSLQSGSDEILRRMHRRYNREEFLKGCELIRKIWPDAAITTDIIVGFPGENLENFEESLEFARLAAFYEAHVFRYSRRKGTDADKMPEQLPEAVKAERSERLIAAAEQLSHTYRKRFLDKTVELLAEEEADYREKKWITGYTREYVRCLLPAQSGSWRPGDLLSGCAKELVSLPNLGECLLLSE